jgi:CHASE2 domain-containing sensor protein/energy-coupling factor transporter ATP-binding protein EcfA2
MILDRLELIQTLSKLPSAQFSELEFSLNLPKGILPGDNAPQGNRAKALLDWAETTGPGLKEVQSVLLQILVTEPPDPEGICPYKGLSYFDCNDEDYHYFYGREALTRTLIEQVTHNNFLAIAGASGSGKSSVLRAGLLQHLRNQGDHEIHILVPGEHPLQNLALAFVDETAGRLDRAEQQGKAENQIKAGADGLRRLVQNSSAPKVVLAIDQFEEAFTLCRDEAERKAFFETLMGASAALSSKLCLILAMRSDFIGKCLEQDYSGLADQVQTHLLSVRPMTQEELTQAITKPAQQAGISLETGLVETLLRDLGQSSGGLPLLQFTLRELWQQRSDHQLKLATYARLGGVTDALRREADRVYESFTSEQKLTAQHIFLNLTQLGDGAEDTRRRVRQNDLVSPQYPVEQVEAVVKYLADANLVVTDEQVDLKGKRDAIVHISHEALIRHWPLLRSWLDENRALIIEGRRLDERARIWKELERPNNLLLGRREVKQVKDLISRSKKRNIFLSNSALDFATKSQNRYSRKKRLKYSFAATITALSFVTTATSSPIIEWFEANARTLMFDIRGPLEPPDDIVILAINDDSLELAEFYKNSPSDFSDLEPIEQWPWQRKTYAIAIERLTQAGASVVALNIILATDSAYGTGDDQSLSSVLNERGDRVVLAASIQSNGEIIQLVPSFSSTSAQIGVINLPLEADGGIHRNGNSYISELRESAENFNFSSFAEATLEVAKADMKSSEGDYINFYGPRHTFQQVPVSDVLETRRWDFLEKRGFFKGKTVLIGTTAEIFQDFHKSPFSGTLIHQQRMAGVEILANDIASLREGKYLSQALSSPISRGALVIVVLAVGCVISIVVLNESLAIFLTSLGVSGVWLGICYFYFLQGLLLPALPALSLLIIGICSSQVSLER